MTAELRMIWELLRENFGLRSVLDMALVGVSIYYVLRLLRGTRAVQLLKGLLVLGALIVLTGTFHLGTVNWMLRQALLPGVIALIILFQPELRMALEQIGRGHIFGAGLTALRREQITRLVEELVLSMGIMVILVGATTSAVLMSSHALPDGRSHSDRLVQAGLGGPPGEARQDRLRGVRSSGTRSLPLRYLSSGGCALISGAR